LPAHCMVVQAVYSAAPPAVCTPEFAKARLRRIPGGIIMKNRGKKPRM